MTNRPTAPSGFNHPPRSLIIEDEAAISGLLEDMVSELGYEVVGTADTSSSALSELDKNNFDVALVDIVLEGGRCPEIADRLQERGRALRLGYRLESPGGTETRMCTMHTQAIRDRQTSHALGTAQIAQTRGGI
jgi:CheY-like chemotaxis protein